MGCGASNANAAVNGSLPMPSDGTTMAPERQPPAAVSAAAATQQQQRAAPVAGPPPPPPTPPSAPPPPEAVGIAGAAAGSAGESSGSPPSFARARTLQPFLSLGPRTAKVYPKSTKIVATLGPPSAKPAMLEKLILAGVNVFRLNFSHSSDHTDVIRDIRRISASLGRHTAILADLQGPKFRTGKTADGKPIPTVVGQRINLVTGAKQAIMDEKNIVTGTEHAHICVRKLEIGMRVLINDGAVVLKVVERKSSEELVCEVLVAGPVGQKKGINTPELTVPVPALTEKDEADAIYALAQDVDFMALSFVQRAADVTQLRDVIAKHILPGRVAPHIIAKIEKPSALDAIDSILEVVDGIMVARGDMGVECSLEKVPTFQKFLIRKANAVRKPVITATQMLESMITNASPTRAEVSDVFNAVLDGTDAVMLSGESAVGAFPLEAVSMMASIVLEAETAMRAQKLSPPKVRQTARFDLSIADSAVYAAFDLNASAIVAVSKHAGFASYLSKSRPLCPIVCVTFSPKVASLLELCFGCHSLVMGEGKEGKDTALFKSSDAFMLAVETGIKDERLGLHHDDTYIFCCSEAPLPGMTNSLQLLRFGHVTELMGRPPMGHADWYAPDTTPVTARGAAPLPVVAGGGPIASTPVVEIHVPA